MLTIEETISVLAQSMREDIEKLNDKICILEVEVESLKASMPYNTDAWGNRGM